MGGGKVKGLVTSVRCKLNPRQEKACRGRIEEVFECLHGNALCQGFPILKWGVIVLLVKLVEGGQLIG